MQVYGGNLVVITPKELETGLDAWSPRGEDDDAVIVTWYGLRYVARPVFVIYDEDSDAPDELRLSVVLTPEEGATKITAVLHS